MNEFFELLHSGHSALGVFVVDVVAFFAMVVVLRALIFLIRYKVFEITDYSKRGNSTPRYLKEGGSPVQSRKGPVTMVNPTQGGAKPIKKDGKKVK